MKDVDFVARAENELRQEAECAKTNAIKKTLQYIRSQTEAIRHAKTNLDAAQEKLAALNATLVEEFYNC